jgi:putative ABC transport system permease protein
MKGIVRIAARNVALNRRRTVITLITIVVAVGAINIGRGVIAGMQRESELNVTEGRTGEIQVHKSGYFEATELNLLDYAIGDYSELRDELRSLDGIAHVAGRVQFGGLIAIGDETFTAFFRGVDAVDEVSVCPRIAQDVIAGHFLTGADSAGCVIAGGLSRGAGMEPGDTVIVVAATRDGFQNAIELEIVGVVEERMAQANRRLVYVPMAAAERLLYMEDSVTEIVIKSGGGGDIGLLRDRIGRVLGGRSLEANTWMEVSAFFVDVMRKQNAVIVALCLIFYVIVMSSITNTMTLSVFERKREIGTMAAIGIKPGDISRLIVTESAMIGVLGSLAGVALGVGVIAAMGRVGITRVLPESTAPVTVYPLVGLRFLVATFLLGVASSVIASVYPVRRALEVNPVEALRSA